MAEPEKQQTQSLVLLSAGGTGGHMFPAAALAKDLNGRGFRVVLATDVRGKGYAESSFADIPVYTLRSGALKPGLIAKIRAALSMGAGYVQARRLLKKLKPAVVVGFGGYPSFPAMLAATHLKIPTVIHEQNAILGKANAYLASRADRIALALEGTGGLAESDAVRAVVTGNPVRPDIAALYNQPYPAIVRDGPLMIFVTGGSQGAGIFGEVLPAAFAGLPDAQKARLDIVQQCRKEDINKIAQAYKNAGIKVHLDTFFDDVAVQLGRAHLVIARSGASTVAEVATAGRPAIFVPYPHHADQQQKRNAIAVENAGGAWVMTQDGFTPDALRTRVETFLQNPEILFRTAEAARACGWPDASRRLGNLVTALASGWDKDARKPYDLTQGRGDF